MRACYCLVVMTTATIKKKIQAVEAVQDIEAGRLAIWRAVSGIWKGRKGSDPVKYQRAIRRDRKFL